MTHAPAITKQAAAQRPYPIPTRFRLSLPSTGPLNVSHGTDVPAPAAHAPQPKRRLLHDLGCMKSRRDTFVQSTTTLLFDLMRLAPVRRCGDAATA